MIFILLGIVAITGLLYKMNSNDNIIDENLIVSKHDDEIETNNQVVNNFVNEEPKEKKKIDEWELTLVNYENALPEDFSTELSSIDKIRKFDSRAIGYLNDMFAEMKRQGVKGVWVQSSYRSVEDQKRVYDEQVAEYVKQGKSKAEAEELTLKIINKPGTSEHNLGLAVDFNYVDLNFENTKGFKWLKDNAEDYGFILRYRKDKEEITKVSYEPWHWRYVGKEHAKKINELDMCLEEYIEFLQESM